MGRHWLGILQRPEPFFDARSQVHSHEPVPEIQPKVDRVLIHRAAEYGLTCAAADAPGDVLSPNRGTVLVRIECPYDRLFRRAIITAPVRKSRQIGRRRVVPVRPGPAVRAVRGVSFIDTALGIRIRLN
jgi:hypothetical protein